LEGFQAEPFSLSGTSNVDVSMEQWWNDNHKGKSTEDWRSSKQYSVPHREHILHCKIQTINFFFTETICVYGDIYTMWGPSLAITGI
jgi:hypothetical protein